MMLFILGSESYPVSWKTNFYSQAINGILSYLLFIQWSTTSWFISKCSWSFIVLPHTSIFYNFCSALMTFNTHMPWDKCNWDISCGAIILHLLIHQFPWLYCRIVELVINAALKLIFKLCLSSPQSLSSFLYSKYIYPR